MLSATSQHIPCMGRFTMPSLDNDVAFYRLGVTVALRPSFVALAFCLLNGATRTMMALVYHG